MTCRIVAVTMTACLLMLPAPCVAQTTTSEVTFKIPLNLTQMPSDIGRVSVVCMIQSPPITTSAVLPVPGAPSTPQSGVSWSETSWPVQGGQVVITMIVVVPVSLADPVGKSAVYSCALRGFSNSLQRWDFFDAANTVAAFRLPSAPFQFNGNFIW